MYPRREGIRISNIGHTQKALLSDDISISQVSPFWALVCAFLSNCDLRKARVSIMISGGGRRKKRRDYHSHPFFSYFSDNSFSFLSVDWPWKLAFLSWAFCSSHITQFLRISSTSQFQLTYFIYFITLITLWNYFVCFTYLSCFHLPRYNLVTGTMLNLQHLLKCPVYGYKK